MSRHKTALKEYEDDYYDDDDYYEDAYDNYDDDYASNYAPPSRTGSHLGDFMGSTVDSSSEIFHSFTEKAHELFGHDMFSEKELYEAFTQNSLNDDVAMSSLLEKTTAPISQEQKESVTPPPPPGLEKPKPLSPSPKRATMGISLSQQGISSTKSPKKQASNPLHIRKNKMASSTPPLPQHLKSRANTGTSSPALKSPSPTLSRSSSRNTLTSSPCVNKTVSLSDDDFEYEDIASSSAARLTLVVAGHVDAGKSTLVGNFLFKLGNVTKRQIHSYEKNSSERGKSSFYLAWVMDESESEREHGVTIGLAERYFSTKNFDFTVLDAPGHRDYIPAMISGANQADVALLVVPATSGEFESSMDNNAQTREHAVLLKSLGVNQVIVVVNKMDMTTPPWSEERYRFIQSEIRSLLTGLQFGAKAIRFVPVSSLTGVNLNPLGPQPSESKAPNNVTYAAGVSCPDLFKWYIGPSLVELMDTFRLPPREVAKPLRAVITTVVSESSKGFDVRVKVLQGTLRKRRRVGIALLQGVFEVKKIAKADGTMCDNLPAGEEASVLLVDLLSRSVEEVRLREGLVLFKGPPFPAVCTKFKASILTFSPLVPPIIPGTTFELYLHGEEHVCRIRKIYSMASSKGDIKKPKCVPGDRTATVKIEVAGPVCIETFEDCRALGRFALRSKGRTCAVGICDSIKIKSKVSVSG